MGENNLLFADAVTNLEDAQIVLIGVPFDGTSSHRAGSARAPMVIRKESYNFETYLPRYDFNIENIKLYDMGDTKKFSNISELIQTIPETIQDIIKSNKFLITLGGEHSISVPVVRSYLEYRNNINKDIGVVLFDAHLDFRDSYLDERFSHACVTRRIVDQLGVENVVSIGTRSYSVEEAETAKDMKLQFYDADTINTIGMEKIIHETIEYLDKRSIYLSIDMDVFDPSYAPGVGNPEFFGLTPWQVRAGIESLAPYLIGADIVEVSPRYDNGNTAALAAQLVQIIISQVSKKPDSGGN